MGLTMLDPGGVYRARVPESYQDKLRERRRISAIVQDLAESSRQVPTPAGLVTIVDARFLAELVSAAAITGETLYAVVDDTHLRRLTGVTLPPVPTKEHAAAVLGTVVTAEEIDRFLFTVKDRLGWSAVHVAKTLDVSTATLTKWRTGTGGIGPANAARVRRLIDGTLAGLEQDRKGATN